MTSYDIYYNDGCGKQVTVSLCISLADAKKHICEMINYQICELSENDIEGKANLEELKERIEAMSNDEFADEMKPENYGITIYDVDGNGYLCDGKADSKTYYLEIDKVEE